MPHRLHKITGLVLVGALVVLLAVWLTPRVADEELPASSALVPARQHLESGDSITAELGPLETQRYTLHLETDQLLHVSAEQRGVDLVAILRREDATSTMVQADTLSGDRGEEHLWLWAREAGEWLLEIRALGSSSHASPLGEYSLRVEIRSPTPEDRLRAQASRLLSQALEGSRELPETQGSLERAEELLRRAGETRLEALVLYQRADREPLLEQQIALFSRARELFAGAGDRGMEMAALQRLGRAWREAGDQVRAQGAQEEALELARRSGDAAYEAISLQNLGVLALGQGKLYTALSLFREALEIFHRVELPEELANALQNLGRLYTVLGHLPEATDALEEACAISVELDDPARQADCLTELAWVRSRLGDHLTALKRMHRVVELRHSVEDRPAEAGTLERLGMVQQAAGLLEAATTSYRDAWKICDETGFERCRASVAGHQASLLLDRGLPALALERARLALTDFRQQGALSGEAYALHLIARSELAQGRLTEAKEAAETGLAVTDSQRDELRLTAASMPFSATRRMYVELHVEILMRLHWRNPAEGWDLRALAAVERFRMRHLLDLLTAPLQQPSPEAAQALKDVEAEIHRLEAERRRIAVEPQRRTEEETSRLEREIRELLNRRAELEARLRHLASPWPTRSLKGHEIEELLAADGESLLLTYFLGEREGALWAVGPDGVTSAPLPPRARVDAVARRALEEIQEGRGTGGPAAREASDVLLGPVRTRLGDRRLLIESEGALHYLPFGALPGDASEEPLIRGHEIVRVPSVTVAMALRERARTRPPPPKTIAVFADPVFQRRDEPGTPLLRDSARNGPPTDLQRSLTALSLRALPDLSASRDEALFIGSLVPRGESLVALGSSMSRERVLSPDLADYRIVHFATHGLVHDLRPELSGLVLSLVDRQGNPTDGFLRAHELSRLQLSADLVVLSACSTALGQEIRGEGLQSLARGFFDAGARRVVVSLWRVHDKATEELMERFYSALLMEGLPPAAALRRAQLDLMASRRWRDPVYWAAFELQGDWGGERPKKESEN